MSASADLLPFVQFDFPGRLGPDHGRYVVRSASGDVQHVLVLGGIDGLAIAARRGRRRRGRAREAKDDAPEVPVTRATVIRPGGFASAEEAERWLEGARASQEEADALMDEGLRIVNRALHAHRLATQDPFGGGVGEMAPLEARIGFGTGDELADGRWSEALVFPPRPESTRRADALRPQERLAATLGRRETTDACETLILRARSDIEGERPREAALQLRIGLEALLAEVSPGAPGAPGSAAGLASEQLQRQTEDLGALTARRELAVRAAEEALEGALSDRRLAEVGETLAICERVLRRRRVLAR